MPRAVSSRYPLTPLLDALGETNAVSPLNNQHGRIASGYGMLGYTAECSQPNQKTCLAELLECSTVTIQRWARDGIPEPSADAAAVKLGLHPASIWHEWWANA